MDFKVGDVVRLKSGGPEMTISGFSPDNRKALCEWFNQTGQVFDFKSHLFDVVVLKRAE